MIAPSHRALRALIAVSSTGLALAAAFVTPFGNVVGAVVLVGLTAFVVLDPGSRLTALLIALHSVNWLASTSVPTRSGEWMLTIVAATVLLVIHLAAALTTALPPSAPLPRPTLLRWGRRGLAVVGLSTPVWAVLVIQSSSTPAGDSLATYAAVVSLAVLALAFWRVQHPRSPRSPVTRAER
ncbi:MULTISPECIES: hypothetical protein [unclassified Knoellia]|uniref:hypothetical protein n=1 Tax=Knoellia altitudinis TaxID=3404795 RepID=UPI00361FBC6F